MPKDPRTLEVILKLSEQCNIDCTYCYYYRSGDDRYQLRPTKLTPDAVAGLSRFVCEALSSDIVSRVRIIMHGGEPLMIGKKRFREFCSAMRLLGDDHAVTLALQTNAMLIDSEWIDLFAEFAVKVCVSVDGPEYIHNVHRIDKKGKGTYQRVSQGIRLLKAAEFIGKINPIAALIVVNPEVDPEAVYNHVVRELGIRKLDFLLPNATHDAPGDAAGVSSYLVRLMELWLEAPNTASVRILQSFMTLMLLGKSFLGGFGSALPLAMTVGSDGEIDGDDFLKPTGVSQIFTGLNVRHASWQDVFTSPTLTRVASEIRLLPDDCADCPFSGVCHGGQATHRFSRARGFNNRSIYCDGLYSCFTQVAAYLIRTGVTTDDLSNRLMDQQPRGAGGIYQLQGA